MRIWSLHPKYLDRLGLLACWREALLAQKVIRGETKGYRHHPQLTRFRSCPDTQSAIAAYLEGLADEAERRGYVFNRARIAGTRKADKIPVTHAQILFEWAHLKDKLVRRDPLWLEQISAIELPEVHPLFESVDGAIEPWEKIQ
jgi:hypothetical protein